MPCRILALVAPSADLTLGQTKITLHPSPPPPPLGLDCSTILVLLLLFVGVSRMSRAILVHIGTEHLNKVYQFEWLMLMGDGSVCGLCS